ncbi:hypothetical protein C3B79_2004 [Aeromonas hydrophila]|nr:hypothetical protein C3B79_2004 [Aeromonas hydrophila]
MLSAIPLALLPAPRVRGHCIKLELIEVVNAGLTNKKTGHDGRFQVQE